MNYKERYKLLNEELSKCEDKTSSLAILLVDSIKELEEKYPEVKESEDDRIRKVIIEHFKGSHSSMYPYKGFTKERILAYLEKQGEQKSVNDLTPQEAMDIAVAKCFEQGEQHPKFRIGDAIKKESTGDIVTISEIDLKNREYRLSNTGFIPFKYEHLWELVEQKTTWSEDDENMLTDIVYTVKNSGYKHCIGVSDETMIEWLKSLKERVLSQQEWGKEDESMCVRTIGALSSCLLGEVPEEVTEEINWLKSLKCKNTWKPSDEQIEAIRLARTFVTDDFGENPTLSEILIELEEQLKKLKG